MKEVEPMTEKRQSPRVKTSIPVRYRVLRQGAEDMGTGSVCDISEGGFRFIAKDLLDTAGRLIVELDIPAVAEPIKAVSQVAWIQQEKGNGQCHVGSRFMEITEKDRELITKYVGSC
jgi:c-di-GMP-binding flagellar brake protein YcgR